MRKGGLDNQLQFTQDVREAVSIVKKRGCVNKWTTGQDQRTR